MSPNRLAIAKILTLYLVTSGIFLLIFFGFLYIRESRALLGERAEELKEARGAIFITVRERGVGALGELSKELDLKFALLHKDKIIYTNLDEIQNFSDGVREHNGRVYLSMRFPIQYDKNGSYKVQKGRHHKGGEGFLILEGAEVGKDMAWLRAKFIATLFGVLVLIGFIAYFLVRLSLKPLNEKIETLNRFIKDSTHEINTPLSIITMSIQTLERKNLSEKNEKKIKNIELAAKNLAHIYEDLVYLNFPHTVPNDIEKIAMRELIKERVEYFSAMALKREIRWRLELEESTLFGSRYKICRMLDNLISNAIKYNTKGGEIAILLAKNRLEIIDKGEGMSVEESTQIFERYTRFNSDQGGFGIGLSLVSQVCKEHEISLKCESQKGSGTRFILEWSKKI